MVQTITSRPLTANSTQKTTWKLDTRNGLTTGSVKNTEKKFTRVDYGDSKIWPISCFRCKLEQYDNVKPGNNTVLLKDSSDKYLIQVA